MGQICTKECVKEEDLLPGFDQKLTHHIITFKTNHVYVARENIELTLMMDQVILMMEDNDHVCFNV